MMCRFCKRQTLFYSSEYGRWECEYCHMSSNRRDTMLFQDDPYNSLPLDDVVIEALLDEDEEPVGFVQHYIPDAERVPELKINVERARLLRHLLKEVRQEERDWGDTWLKENGFRITVTDIDPRSNRKVFVWEKRS